MKLRARNIIPLLLASTPILARADSWAGLGVFFGVCTMAIASLLYGVLAIFRRLHVIVYSLATLIFVPLMWSGLLICGDAIEFNERQGYNSEMVYWYFFLFGLVIALYAIVAWKYWRKPALPRAS
jgi:hypothetical protein